MTSQLIRPASKDSSSHNSLTFRLAAPAQGSHQHHLALKWRKSSCNNIAGQFSIVISQLIKNKVTVVSAWEKIFSSSLDRAKSFGKCLAVFV